jgi:hypothetical protein
MASHTVVAACLASIAWTTPALGPIFSVSPPAIVADLDFGTLKGVPSCLAWSADGGELYLQTVDDKRTLRHFLVHAGAPPKETDGEPIWASTYWDWKSSRAVPGHRELVIQVATKHDTDQIPSQDLHAKAAGADDGAIALRGMADAGIGAKTVRTLMLGDDAIGEYVDAPLVPGMTFGWSPESLQSVAFVAHNGRLVLMDVVSRVKQEVGATSGVQLPAWSPDGSAIVYLQKTGKRTAALMRVSVSRP